MVIHLNILNLNYLGNVNTIGPRGVYDEAKRYLEALTVAYKTKKLDVRIVRILIHMDLG